MSLETVSRRFFYLDRLYVLSLCLLILATFLGSRSGLIIMGKPGLEKIQGLFFYSTLFFSILVLLREQKKFIFAIVLLWGLLLLDAFAHYFQPSLTGKVPLQDFLLSDRVSAMWSFELAKTYCKHLLGYFLIFYPLWSVCTSLHRKWVAFVFLGSAAINVFVALIQATYSLNFLSVGANIGPLSDRVPGLLIDSGAFAVFLSMLTGALLWSLMVSKAEKKMFLVQTLILFVLFYIGITSSGRVYFATSAVNIVILALYRIGKLRTLKSSAHWVYGILCFAVLLLFASYLFTQNDSIALNKIKNLSLKDFVTIEGLERVDYQRTKHILAMWDSFQNSFPFGKGLGSFHSLCNNIASKYQWENITLDWPSNFYLQMLSELGIGGLVLLLILFLLFFNNIFSSRRNFFQTIALGAFFSLILSWFIGIHYIFKSSALMLGALLAFLWSKSKVSIQSRILKLYSLVCVFLLCSILYLFMSAPPNATTFLWKETGHPQNPNRGLVDIQGKLGQTYKRGGELLLDTPHFLLGIEDGDAFDVDFEIFHSKNGKIAELSLSPIPNQWIEWTLEEALYEQCKEVSLENHCYVVVHTKHKREGVVIYKISKKI